MAVAPTGAIYKALEFDGVSSRTYGVYITGEAVYNAPERDVEMIAIPGRNGSFALDKGRFENIEVSYPAGIFADAESDFAEAVSDFRNFLCSRNGYVRLQDEYNPNEYRMAVYKSGLEVTPAQLKAGEFNIVFECKPQRWLTSGESAVTVGEWSDWETESGPIVEIEASETDKVKSLSVALEPIQDLHGYNSPWIGTDVDKVPYLKRAVSSIDTEVGNSQYDKIVGGTVAWNQLVQNGNFADTTGWDARNATVSVSGNVASVTVSSTGTERGLKVSDNSAYQFAAVVGHKYLISAEINAPITGEVLCAFSGVNGVRVPVVSNTWTDCQAIYTPTNTTGQVTLYIRQSLSQGEVVQYKNVECFDLTQMLGSTIADYIYTLEQGTAGSGVAFFKRYFGDDYYPYDSGSIHSVEGLVSHDMVGFNQWDEEWEVGTYSNTTGAKVNASDRIRSKNFILIMPNTQYFVRLWQGATYSLRLFYYDKNQNFINSPDFIQQGIITTPNNAYYMTFICATSYGTTYNHDICINISDASLNGQYKAYEKHSYPLDSTVTLRGLLKLEDGKLKADGDVYKADGSVTRKYGVVDAGTINWQYDSTNGFFYYLANSSAVIHITVNSAFVCAKYAYGGYKTDAEMASVGAGVYSHGGYVYIKDSAYTDAATFKTAMNGVMLVYELAEPTTESATSFASPQAIVSGGTEEYVSTSIVPVGHETKYANICPISGRTECVTYVSGINVWDEEWELGVFNTTTGVNASSSTQIRTKNYIPVVADTNYYVKANPYVWVMFFDSDKNVITDGLPNTGGASANARGAGNQTVKMPTNCAYIRFYCQVSYGTTYNHDISINYPSTDTSYHAYNGTSYTTDLGRTVYGGTLEQVGGTLTDTMGYIASYNGETIGEPWISDRDEYVEGTTPSIGAEVVYTLATPQTYQLDPQQIDLLLGTNNVWSDGDVTLEYGQDPNVIVNPTLFEASPLLEVDGYGNIQFNGYDIDIENVLLGDVVVSSTWEKTEYGYQGQQTYTINFINTSLLNAGDTISLNGAREVYQITLPQSNPQNVVVTYDERTNLSVTHTLSKPYMIFSIALDPFSIQYGTSSTWTAKMSGDVTMTGGGIAFAEQITFTYSGGDSINITTRMLAVGSSRKVSLPTFIGDSTQPLTETKYIDCEAGEAYLIHNDETLSINNAVQLGSDLPKFAPGSNAITYDNTITSLNVVPRWWKI